MSKAFCRAAIRYCVLAACSTFLVAQSAPSKKSLVVNGHSAPGAVIQIDDHSYVDVVTFAQLTNGSVKYEADRVVLSIPVAPPEGDAKEASNAQALSKEFARAAVTFVAEGREWKAAIASAVRTGGTAGPWIGPWLQEYRARTEQALNQAAVAAATKADQQALELLRSVYASIRDWDTQSETEIQNLNGEKTVNPQSLSSDPLLGKISDCSSFLSAMLMSGKFEDHTNCH